MRSISVWPRGFCVAAAVIIGACGGCNREAPKVPLHPSSTASTGASAAGSPTGGISGEAKTALDSGNVLFRAKAYDRALAQYRRSARLAPTELAPLFGILMVTGVTRDAKLADSTLSRMRELNPAAADSSVAMPHGDIVGAHSRAGKAAPLPPAKKGESGAAAAPIKL